MLQAVIKGAERCGPHEGAGRLRRAVTNKAEWPRSWPIWAQFGSIGSVGRDLGGGVAGTGPLAVCAREPDLFHADLDPVTVGRPPHMVVVFVTTLPSECRLDVDQRGIDSALSSPVCVLGLIMVVLSPT
jgi:hypothetical protein